MLPEERCTDSGAGPEGPAGAWSGGQYSSDVRVVDWCTRGGVHEVNSQEM